LHRAAAPALRASAFHTVLREQASRHAIALANDVARIASHDATSNPQDAAMWDQVRGALSQAGAAAPTLAELAATLGVKDAALRDFLHRKAKGGEVVKVAIDRFYLRATIDKLAQAARDVAQAAPNGLFTAAQFRDAIGATRAVAIPVLEALDRMGVTQRVGDNRRVKP
jgi:selenocysteine-specific elongation factor